MAVADFLPGFVAWWITAFARTPGAFLGLAVAIAVLLAMGAKWQRRIQDQMRRLWEEALDLPRPTEAATASARDAERWIYRLRTNHAYQGAFCFLKWKLGPNVFGAATLATALLLFVSLPLLAVHRVQLAAAERSNAICQLDGEPQALLPEEFSTKSLCWATGSRVEAGRRYRVTLTVRQRWIDDKIETDPVGFESEQLPWYARYTAAALRRTLSGRWFQPMVKIVPSAGKGSSHVEAVDFKPGAPEVYSAEFVAARSGEVFVFVNDAIISWLGLTQEFYDNNGGTGLVQIEPMDADVREAAITVQSN